MLSIQPFQNADRLRERTLSQFRWVAIIGQLIALAIAYAVFDFRANYFLILWVIFLWAIVNLAQGYLLAARPRLRPALALVVLLIDVVELTVVLSLTGGLNNPFALLLIVPAVLGAVALNGRELIIIIMVTLIALALLFFDSEALEFGAGTVELPAILQLGFLISLVVMTLFLSFFLRRSSVEAEQINTALAASELALQRELRLSSLGGLVAAYAHELGTPLATVRLIAGELLDGELDAMHREDIEVIAQEARRSSEILGNMGRLGKADLMVRHVPFINLVEEAAEPHQSSDKIVSITIAEDAETLHTAMPYVERSSAIIHGLRNLIHNAVSFAKSRVDVSVADKRGVLSVTIADDGPGFAADILSRIGEPIESRFISKSRENYEGMGLGMFISKTLLESNSAQLNFGNRPCVQGGGAIIRIYWRATDIVVDTDIVRAPLGDNPDHVQ